MRRLENFVRKYGPEYGPVLNNALQSQATHASVSSRLRRKIDVLTGKAPAGSKPEVTTLPLFPGNVQGASEASLHAAISA